MSTYMHHGPNAFVLCVCVLFVQAGMTPLHRAVAGGHELAAKRLDEAGTGLDLQDKASVQ